MTEDKERLEKFLNELVGEVISIIPNVASKRKFETAVVDFLLVVERIT